MRWKKGEGNTKTRIELKPLDIVTIFLDLLLFKRISLTNFLSSGIVLATRIYNEKFERVRRLFIAK